MFWWLDLNLGKNLKIYSIWKFWDRFLSFSWICAIEYTHCTQVSAEFWLSSGIWAKKCKCIFGEFQITFDEMEMQW